MAINVLDLVGRQLRLDAVHSRAHRERLEGLGCRDDVELCGRIRAGAFSDRYVELADALRELAWDKLSVVNPSYPGDAAGPHDRSPEPPLRRDTSG